MLTVDIIFPVLPPALDGIGDHTAQFARALAPHADVRILTAQPDAAPITGVTIESVFSTASRRDITAVADAIAASPPDVLLLQFNQFSYGRWGLNPYLPWTLQRIKRAHPQLCLAWMAHEDFVPPTSWKYMIMRQWQRWQFKRLGALSDLVFFSIEPWAQRYGPWFADTPVYHLPVGSNMPYLGVDRQEARDRLGFSDSTFVAGVFGTINPSRLMPFVRAAGTALHEHTDDLVLLYVGPNGAAFNDATAPLPIHDAGTLPAREVSLHLSAMDLHLTPFIDGVSTRRGSFLAGLQHGLPTVATRGPLTDDLLIEADGEALLLADIDDADGFARHAVTLLQHPDRRSALGRAGQALFDEALSMDVTVDRFLHALEAHQVVDSPSLPTSSSPR
jgi:glycosyltransferase involved in cell wall biosynthesis